VSAIRPGAPALLALLVVMGCGPTGVGDSARETRRGPVSLEGQEAERDGPASLWVTVPSCNGEPEVVEFDERDTAIHLEVVTTQVVRGDRDDCLDAVRIELDEPLGEREVIDAVSGSSLPIGPELVVELTCFDADYPTEPTFASPDEAFVDALDAEAEPIDAPGDPASYERNDVDDGWVEYEVRPNEDQHLTWGVTQDERGDWGMTSLGGCWPAGP
jgi:hypothetical protein